MLTHAERANFTMLAGAFDNGDAALVQVRRVADGATVAAICAVGRDGDEFAITPFAVMVEGNPFDLLEPPCPGGGFVDSKEAL